MAFDPKKYGATPVEDSGFDPKKYGATQVDHLDPYSLLGQPTIKQTLSQKLQNFRNEAVAPYVARQQETNEASRLGEQTPVQTAFQTGGNIIGAGIAPVVAGVGKVVEKVAPVASKIPGAGIVSGIAKRIGGAYDFVVDKASDNPLVQEIAGDKKMAWERDLEAVNEYLQVIPVGKTGKITSTALKEINATKKVAEIAKAKSEIEKISGMVSQGKKGDIPAVVKTLSNVDTKGVKTYSDLTRKLDEKSSSLVSALDEKLAQDTQKIKLSDSTLSEKVPSKFGEVEVKHNFVQDALNQLDELYTKTNDPVNKRVVEIMRQKADADGLSVLELNGIARKYGSEFSGKAFGKTGEPLTSVNAQAFENTRSGLKDTARQFYGDESFKVIDEEISRVIKTKDLVKRVDESVNKLRQRVTERSLGAKAGRAVFNLIDTISGGSLGGLVRAAVIPRGAGLKVMNALDIEAILKQNLERIKELQKIIEDTPTENILLKKLQEFGAKVQNTPNKEGGFLGSTKQINPIVYKELTAKKDEILRNTRLSEAQKRKAIGAIDKELGLKD